MSEKVAIIGASPKPARYSYRAMQSLKEHEHQVYLVNPAYGEIEGKPVFKEVNKIPEAIDTITMYISGDKCRNLESDIVEKKPKRVIFNPGSECGNLKDALSQAGIEVVEACTLVLLSTGQFEKHV